MSKNGVSKCLPLTDLITAGKIDWGKKSQDWRKAVGGAQVVYEDDHVIAFHDPVDAPHESPRTEGEIRITVLPKEPVGTLMDLNVTHEPLNARMLFAVQQVAYKLGLHKQGFEVREHVLPPYQHRPGYALRIRAGKAPAESRNDSSASSAASSPNLP
jgi:diadenosine tetraphosphate (Ap4A) HIT family hydrolase